jgi:hypothetical protein
MMSSGEDRLTCPACNEASPRLDVAPQSFELQEMLLLAPESVADDFARVPEQAGLDLVGDILLPDLAKRNIHGRLLAPLMAIVSS